MSLVEDQGFALGVVDGGAVRLVPRQVALPLTSYVQVTQMHTIMSSDPSRGTLALEEGAYIPPGKEVAVRIVLLASALPL